MPGKCLYSESTQCFQAGNSKTSNGELWWGISLKKLSLLMLCTPIFILTTSSSTLLGHPHCGSSIWLSLLALFNTSNNNNNNNKKQEEFAGHCSSSSVAVFYQSEVSSLFSLTCNLFFIFLWLFNQIMITNGVCSKLKECWG